MIITRDYGVYWVGGAGDSVDDSPPSSLPSAVLGVNLGASSYSASSSPLASSYCWYSEIKSSKLPRNCVKELKRVRHGSSYEYQLY